MGIQPPTYTGVPAVVPAPAGSWFLARPNLQVLIDLLRADGWSVIGPTVADGAIVLEEIESVTQLPAGVRDEQAPGRYRFARGADDRLFDFTVGPTSPKGWTFPSRVPLAIGRRDQGSVVFQAARPEPPQIAFLGIRACELAALRVADRVFLGGPFTDEDYRARRTRPPTVAVECRRAAPASHLMGTGGRPRGADSCSPSSEGFIVRVGSAAAGRFAGRRDPDQTSARDRSTRPEAIGDRVPRAPRPPHGPVGQPALAADLRALHDLRAARSSVRRASARA
jgi:hypothetical protein